MNTIVVFHNTYLWNWWHNQGNNDEHESSWRIVDTIGLPTALFFTWAFSVWMWASGVVPPRGEWLPALSAFISSIGGVGWLLYRIFAAASVGRKKEIAQIDQLNEQIRNLNILLQFQQKEYRSLVVQLDERQRQRQEQNKTETVKAVKQAASTANEAAASVRRLEEKMDSSEITIIKTPIPGPLPKPSSEIKDDPNP